MATTIFITPFPPDATPLASAMPRWRVLQVGARKLENVTALAGGSAG